MKKLLLSSLFFALVLCFGIDSMEEKKKKKINPFEQALQKAIEKLEQALNNPKTPNSLKLALIEEKKIFEKALLESNKYKKQLTDVIVSSISAQKEPLRYSKGYLFIRSNDFKGQRSNRKIDVLKRAEENIEKSVGRYAKKRNFFENQKKRIEQALSQEYKIHLMPKSQAQLLLLVKKFLTEIANSRRLQYHITSFKIKFPINFYDLTEKEDIKEALKESKLKTVMPVVVIYPTSGKKEAQYVLDKVYELFGELEGLDITPRFNEKVTSLIYFAQGAGGHKGDSFAHYYEPNKVYYKPFKKGDDYHLINPAKKQPSPSKDK